MTRQHSTLIPTLALLFAANGFAQSQKKPEGPVSPEERIVEKYHLDKALDRMPNQIEASKGVGCHAPLPSGPEKKTYKNFRTVAARGQQPESLLLICKEVQGFPEGTLNAFSYPDTKTVFITEGVPRMPKGRQKSVIGHEVTHIVRGDDPTDISTLPEIKAFQQFEVEALKEIAERQRDHIPITREEAIGVINAEQALMKRAQAALDRVMSENHDMEKASDVGGVILAAGPGCKVRPENMVKSLDEMLHTMPAWVAQGTFSHPSFKERERYLHENTKAIVDACKDYYTDAKKNEPDKRPPGRGR